MSVLFRANTDVIVKGMRMPSGCAKCPIAEDYEGVDFCRVMPHTMKMDKEFREAVKAGTKPEWCPLVEVPAPHGRLIDIEAAYKGICDKIENMTKCGIVIDSEWLWNAIRDTYYNAPTIIEAEGGDAND